MTPEQRQLFEELVADRLDSLRVFQKKSIGGIWRGIVDKYSDKAHFIYELLQNADDSHATEARFDVRQSELFFAHNGTHHFTISPIEHDNGDVNAITAVGDSNKNIQEVKIGKFGVGFKSVFQYTDAPQIYDQDFCFRIENYIVPFLLKDVPNDVETMRSAGWTVFVFPFKDGMREQSVSDISLKLKSLDRPLLFLNCLRKIEYKNASESGAHEIEFSAIPTRDDSLHVETVCNRHATGNGETSISEYFVKFSRVGPNGHPFSVVFGTEGHFEKLQACQGSVYCFFPTQLKPDLKFLVHAPFLLTDSREGVQDTDYNADLIDKLGLLAADSLVFLRDWGIERGSPIIDDDVFNVVPTDKSRFFDFDLWRKCWARPHRFAPIFARIQSCLKERGLLSSTNSEPLADRYVVGANAYWAQNAEIPKLFDNSLLAELIGKPDAKWVFTTSGRPVDKNPLRDYKDGLIVKPLSFPELLDKLSRDFLSTRPREWLERLYLFIQKHYSSSSQLENVKSKAIFLGKDGLFYPATQDSAGKPQPSLFLPSTEAAFENAAILEPSLLGNPELEKFFKETLQLKKPSIRDEVINSILPKYQPDETIEHPMEDMTLIFRAWRDGTEKDREAIENIVKNTPCLLADDGKWLHPSSLYLPSEDLHLWFEGRDVHFLAMDKYQESFPESDFAELVRFFAKLGIRSSPKIIKRRETEQERAILEKNFEKFPPSSPSSGFGRRWVINSIEGLEGVLHRTTQTRDPRLSVLLWNMLQRFFENHSVTSLSALFEAHYEWYY